MSKKFKLGKISLVVFLTALIWVWADLAQDEPLIVSDVVKITVATSSDPNLWVSLGKAGARLQSSLTIDSVVLKGPASRVREVERMKNRGALDLDLFLVPEQWDFTEPRTHRLPTLTFLRQSDEIKQLGLTVETCEPNEVEVHVRRLTIDDVAVECVDEKGRYIAAERLEPERVKAPVPPEGVPVARVRLTRDEQKRAMETPLEKRPSVELPDGQERAALDTVTIKLKPPSEEVLKSYSVSATLGFCVSQNLQGKYRVELRDDPTGNPVLIKATPLAYEAYNREPFHVIVYIKDSDRQSTDFIPRQVVFTFPEEYVRRGEIEPVDQTPPEVQFRLVPLPTETAGGSGP